MSIHVGGKMGHHELVSKQGVVKIWTHKLTPIHAISVCWTPIFMLIRQSRNLQTHELVSIHGHPSFRDLFWHQFMVSPKNLHMNWSHLGAY